MRAFSRFRISLLLLAGNLFVLQIIVADAQLKSDPAYIQSYDTMVTARIFLSQKYLALHIRDKNDVPVLKYYPNSKLNLGVGATYGWFTVNVSAGLGFMNNSKAELAKGKTRALDLQAHLYGPKLVIDLFGQYYKGFYLSPQGTAAGTNSNWYRRPDLSLLQLGVSGYYLLNWQRFSYRAAYLQNEWQTKSAGSVLLGGEVFYELAKADSAFVPAAIKNGYQSASVNRMQSGKIGPGAGYAYTLVLAKHFFISASLTGGLTVNVLKESGVSGSTKFAFNPDYAFKTGIGYNSRKFSASFTWVNNTVIAAGEKATYLNYAGNARFHLAYRFVTKARFRKNFSFLHGTVL